jgi:hypothetical protein
MHRSVATGLSLAVLLAACGTARSARPATSPAGAPTVPASTSVVTPPGTSAPSQPAGMSPRPSGTLPWPSTFAAPLDPARYSLSPPFEMPISLAIPEAGWYAGHLHSDFIDLQRFDGVDVGTFPTKMLGFGLPGSIRGVDGAVAATGLTPSAAIDLLRGRSSIKATNAAAVALIGLAGERVDLHSELGSNPIFATSDGAFGLGPELDLRLAVLPLDGGLLLVVVLAPTADLDAAWQQVLPTLDSATLEG